LWLQIFVVIAVVLLSQLGISAAYAAFINGGFEAGDTSGWVLSIPPGGTANAVISHAGNSSTYSPVEGPYFLELKTDGPGSYTTASQTLSMAAGDVVDGWAAFDYQDYSPYNDNAFVQILSGITVIATPWSQQGNDHPDYWDGPWEAWSWTATANGVYTLQLGVANSMDSIVDSYALFDANVYTPIPEPSTMILLGAGILGLIGLGSRKFLLKRFKK
jgi:hypothetical protein